MTVRLVALRVPPAEFADRLREVWSEGDAVLPLPWGASEPTIAATLERLRPAVLVERTASGSRRTDLDAARQVVDGTALVVTTSGTTGFPRGVVLSHDALAASTSASVARLAARRGERFALALPLDHIAGIQVVLRSWHCGTDPVVADPSLPIADDAEHVSLVPTQLARLVAHASSSLSGWRSMLVGGGPVDLDLVEAARRTGAGVVRSYGMTETCGGCVYDGVPFDGVEVRIGSDGRIRLRGPVLATGYHPDGVALTDDEGWFDTNDLGTVHEGELRVHGRADDVVVSGGENIPAHIVADTLRAHPGLLDAAVLGWPDHEWGAIAVAVVTADGPAPSLDEIRAHVRRSHPAAWAPRELVVVDVLARDELGKLQRTELEAQIRAHLG